MKTQISGLINGSKNVLRNESHEKYVNAKRSTSHIGYSGTNARERKNVSEQVYAENGDTLHVEIRGVELTLQIHKSSSGKSWFWSAEISKEQYVNISKTYLGIGEYLNTFSVLVNCDCTVYVQSFHKKTPNQIWRNGYTHTIDEAFVTIL